MTDGYSRLFSQGLMFHAHPAAPSVLQPPAIIEPVHSSTRSGQIHRRRRSSITVEGSTSPISLLRSPSRAAAQAFSRLLRSPSRPSDHPVRRVPAQAPKLERYVSISSPCAVLTRAQTAPCVPAAACETGA
ncbi:hypothetical protein EXIGLDRAFT_496696 [Exidia glandulosa HHB12029]|uniref:Uncharacterized protein n=1 Tax=Exidia glandulosa HHB12029 TaxID=1314781 RepID=A0A165JHM5_EXIGL|nr:hypothetical protein EXIGLDRAFT_496696 [Exidia glandulosa HHB12029]